MEGMAEKKSQKMEQELQQKMLMYQLLQGQLEELKKQGTLLQSRFTEIEMSRIALEELKKSKDGSEILVPLGNGIYSSGKAVKGDFLVDAGAGVFIKKPPEEAGKLIEEKSKESEALMTNLQNEMINVANKMNEIAEELQKEMTAKK